MSFLGGMIAGAMLMVLVEAMIVSALVRRALRSHQRLW
jgi:hypothetical protein